MAPVQISIPPRSVYVGVVRLAVGSLARQAGCAEDVVDDLRIAVTEACTSVVLAHERAGNRSPVEVLWDEAGDRLVIEVRGRVPAPEPDEATDSSGFSSRDVLSLALIDSLVDDSEVSSSSEGTLTRLVLDTSDERSS